MRPRAAPGRGCKTVALRWSGKPANRAEEVASDMVGKALSAVGGLSSLAYLSADPEPSCREPYTNDVFNVTGQYLFAGLAQTGISKHGCMSPSDAHSVLGLPYNASKEEVCLSLALRATRSLSASTPRTACFPLASVKVS
jgi:hypothetical protein